MDLISFFFSSPFSYPFNAGNAEVMTDISENVDFDYIHILRRLHSSDNLVRLLAGGALAAFAYNNVTQQKEIAESGGIRYHSFVPFLESNDEFFRCNAAFQVCHLSINVLINEADMSFWSKSTR